MKNLAQSLAAGAGGALVVGMLMAQAQTSPMIVRSDGLEFPDGSVQTTAATMDSRQAYYLTDSSWDGASALNACETGFHMASFWEVFDPSNLRYANEVPDAQVGEDSGSGPPADGLGWTRTGYISSHEDTPGRANCEGWTSSDNSHSGTIIWFRSDWTDSGFEKFGAWTIGSVDCENPRSVWCIED